MEIFLYVCRTESKKNPILPCGLGLKVFPFSFFFFSITFIEIAVCYWPSESQDHWVLSRFLQKQKGGSGIVSYLEPSIWRWVVVLRITGAYRRYNWTTIHLGCVLFYSSFSQPCHISMCAMWASSDVRCRFLEHFFLGLSCFGSGPAGLAPPGRSALASVPELHVSSFRHATWLNFADFLLFWWFFCVSHPVIHNSLCHRRLACTCRDSQLFRGFGNNSCDPFYRWFSWGRTIVYPDAFVLHSKIYSRSVFDDVWWPIFIYGSTSQLFVSVTSNCCR